MTVKILSLYARAPIEVKSAYNNKVLCKKYNEKKHADIADREITSLWSEIRTNNSGFSSFSAPVICVYVVGDKEYSAENKEATHV